MVIFYFHLAPLCYLFAHQTLIGISLIAIIIAIAVIITCLVNTEVGLYITIIYSFFSFAFSRFFYEEFPIGVASDVLIIATLFSLFVKKVNLKNTFKQFTNTSVIIAIAVLFFI